MLRTISPNISVVTNFGCQTNCWYCIWKEHSLRDIRPETNWEKLEAFLRKYKNKGKVSVSGGGDCLYDFERFEPWWSRFFGICDELRMQVDVHSREKFMRPDFWRRINRAVVSSDNLDDDFFYLLFLLNHTKLRITHVVTKETTDEIVEAYLKFQLNSGCQFTFKKLVDHDDGGRYEQIKAKYPTAFFLGPGDYNIYYMPDNTEQQKFLY